MLLLSSGSVLLTAYRGRKYEESVPLTVFAAIEVVFLAGLAGRLRLGVYLLCALGAAAYALALRRVARNRAWKAFARDTFTPGFFLFWGLLALYAVCVCGHVARHGDEFSFWAVSVKHMWVTDQFHSLSYSAFPEYPPGMQIFEFILLVLRGEPFSEWRMLFAYTAFTFAVALPFLKGLRWREPEKILLAGALIFCSGAVFFDTALDTLVVDLALACVFAFAMATAISGAFPGDGPAPDRDRLWSLANVALAANAMVLIKQSGAFLAILALLAFAAGAWRKGPAGGGRRKLPGKAALAAFGGACLLPVSSRLLWQALYRSVSTPPDFDLTGYNWGEFFRILFLGQDGGYRTAVCQNFFRYLLEEPVSFGFFQLTYCQLLILLAAGALLLYGAYRGEGRRLSLGGMGVLFAGSAAYILGLLSSYMYTFSQEEGMALASINRYLSTYYAGIFLTGVFLFLALAARTRRRRAQVGAVFLLLLCLPAYSPVARTLSRVNTTLSIQDREPYQELYQQILDDPLADGTEDTVLLIHREGYPHIPLNHFGYLLYPDYTVPWECSYGSQLLFEGDTYTQLLDSQAFLQRVYGLEADYIAIDYVDEDFIAQYATLFDSPLANGQVYRVSAAPSQGPPFTRVSAE